MRTADHPIEPLFLERWSPRAFTPAPMPEQDLLTAFEAARWAPSAYNLQPWRFLYALRGDPCWDRWLDLLVPFNRGWARNSSALVFVLSQREVEYQGQISTSRSHSFDTGAAWAQLALQLAVLGYHAHGIGGLDYDRARNELGIPGSFTVEIAVAVGSRGAPEVLSEELRSREEPSPRRTIDASVARGGFPW